MARSKPPPRRTTSSSTRTPTRHGRGVRVGATIIIAALVLSLVGGLLAIAATDRDGSETLPQQIPTPSPAPGFPKLAPTLVPVGLDLQAIIDLTATPASGGPPSTYFLFGAGPESDPFADRDVVLGVTVGLGSDAGFDPTEGTLTVGEDPAVGFIDPLTGADGISWSPAPGEAWTLLSRTLDQAELAELAAELSAAEDIQGLADGELELVAIGDTLLGALSGPGDGSATDAGHNIVYGGDSQDGRSLSFWALPAHGTDLITSRWVLGGTARTITLPDGTEALTGTLAISPDADASATVNQPVTYTTLEWTLDGVALSIAAVGVDLDEMVALADSVRLLGDSEWAALVSVANSG